VAHATGMRESAMQVVLADYCFIDFDRRQVIRKGRQVELSPKAYELLSFLVEARPKAVAKERLFQALWPSTFVVEANLPNLVAEIRAALGDSARNPRVIRTIHRFGYAFVGPTDSAPGEGVAPERPMYCLRSASFEIPLANGENIVGREAGMRARIDDAGVSRRHARIVIEDERTSIEDLGSKNGTFVRGRRVTSRVTIESGDELHFGPLRVMFLRSADDPATQTARTNHES
jgi:DNA-binding winged helix-turn-helix (wHTH) protein